jgi:hypothetical protein
MIKGIYEKPQMTWYSMVKDWKLSLQAQKQYEDTDFQH